MCVGRQTIARSHSKLGTFRLAFKHLVCFCLTTHEEGILRFIDDQGPPVVIITMIMIRIRIRILFVLKKRWELIFEALCALAESAEHNECNRKTDCLN